MAARSKPPVSPSSGPAPFTPDLGPGVSAAAMPPPVPPMRPAPAPAPPHPAAVQAAPATPNPTPSAPASVHPAPAAAGGGNNPPPPVAPTPAAVAAPEPQPETPSQGLTGGEQLSPIRSVAEAQLRQRAAAAAGQGNAELQRTPVRDRAEVPTNDRRMLIRVGGAVLALLILAGIGLWAVWPKGQQQAIPVSPTPVVVHPPAAVQPPPVIIHNYPPAATPAPAQPQPLFSGNPGSGGQTAQPSEPVDGDGPKVKVAEPTWLIRN